MTILRLMGQQRLWRVLEPASRQHADEIAHFLLSLVNGFSAFV